MCLKLVVFYALFFVVFILVYFVDESQALEASDVGACVAKISSIQIRRKSYSVIIWRSGRKRAVRRFKTESYLTWTNHTICCQGWQHNSDLDICIPVCSTGCLNGKCIAPSTCHCEPPLYLDPERLNACLTPICDPPCFNSVCNINNICECDSNTRRYNKTHCANCDEHHSISPDLTCHPICERQCVNGECTAPNTCSCLDGYVLADDKFTCTPLCPKCVNSTCVAPNVCSCFEGHSAVDETTCAPKCDSCTNGFCVAPGQCKCLDGYINVNGSCEAVCEIECDNGFCSSPNVCSCDEGFVMRNGVCSKPCRPECNGTCDLEGQCTPGLCTTFVDVRGQPMTKRHSAWNNV